ncbi:MAG: hypothetical protein ACREO1_10715 [Arenimonas sp.]
MNEKTLDAELLTRLIQLCFKLSQKPGITETQSRNLIVLGKKLRGVLINVLTSKFDASTQLFIDSTDELRNTNKALKEALDDLQKTADAIKKATGVLKLLDKLLQIAVGFL